MKQHRLTSWIPRALLMVTVIFAATGSDCTSCTVPNPNFRKRDASVDAPVDATPVPHYHYVINKLLIPTSSAESIEYALDLNGDGTPDNAMGTAFVAMAALGTTSGFQVAADRDVLAGKIIMLVDVQTPDFSNAEVAGVQLYLGDNPQPAPCNATETVECTDTNPAACNGCGHHLTDGTFSIAATSPNYPAITGSIVDGTFVGGPGAITLMLSLGDSDPIRFDLIGAKIKASGISEANIGSVAGAMVTGGLVIGGALTQESLDGTVVPGIRAQLNATVTAECNGTYPTCCVDTDAGQKAQSILNFLNLDPKDCTISLAEVQAKMPLLLRQDVMIDGKPAYSLGVKAAATKATFTVPGQ